MADAQFLAGAATLDRLPKFSEPQVAFAGRSNVGKSSLINRLTGRRALARVSRTPGRTQQINFFRVDHGIVFVDLPGYGFARVPLSVKAGWKTLVEGYLGSDAPLRGVVVIVDIRRGVEPDDLALVEFLVTQGIGALVVATKCDRIKQSERRGLLAALTTGLKGRAPFLLCSSNTGEGMSALQERIRQWCA